MGHPPVNARNRADWRNLRAVAIFPRKKSEEPLVVAVVPDREPGTKPAAKKPANTPKKGKPTPKRADAQAARRTPVVASTVSRQPQTKEEKAAARVKDRADRDAAYRGMKAGEEKHLPARDKGAQRRYVRQYVDARWNLGEYFMPVAFGFIVANFAVLQLGVPALAFGLILGLYAVVIGTFLDVAIMWHRLKRLLIAKFGEVERGTMMYAGMRALQIRRLRIPTPTHRAHGRYPS